MNEDLQDWIGWLALCILGAALFVGLHYVAQRDEAIKEAKLAHAAFIESCVQEQKLYRCEIQYRSMKQ